MRIPIVLHFVIPNQNTLPDKHNFLHGQWERIFETRIIPENLGYVDPGVGINSPYFYCSHSLS